MGDVQLCIAFNKGHFTCYAYVAFRQPQMLNYPSEFMAALLDQCVDKHRQVIEYSGSAPGWGWGPAARGYQYLGQQLYCRGQWPDGVLA